MAVAADCRDALGVSAVVEGGVLCMPTEDLPLSNRKKPPPHLIPDVFQPSSAVFWCVSPTTEMQYPPKIESMHQCVQVFLTPPPRNLTHLLENLFTFCRSLWCRYVLFNDDGNVSFWRAAAASATDASKQASVGSANIFRSAPPDVVRARIALFVLLHSKANAFVRISA